MTKSQLIVVLFTLSTMTTQVKAGVLFGDPAGGWVYQYDGEDADAGVDPFTSLDGSWDHENGSDQWDGSTILDGNPGGVMVLDDPDDGTIFLRMVDTGDPRDLGIAEPSNRKFFFGHDIGLEGAPDNVIDEGVTLSFRGAFPTDGPLAGISPGDGYVNHDSGKSTFTISQADPPSTISFFLANEEEDNTSFEGPGLGMNSLDEAAGGGTSGTVDWQGDEGTPNLFTLNDNDPTQWHEFWINIFSPGLQAGSHTVVVYADGDVENPQFFDVTAGQGRDYSVNYITMGLGATPQSGAVDIDFFSWAPGILEAVGNVPVVPGDANGDGKVNAADLNVLGGNWQKEVANGIAEGDFNEDGFVNASDLNILGGNWQFGVGEAPANAAVPEPASHTLTIFMMCFVAFFIRRRK